MLESFKPLFWPAATLIFALAALWGFHQSLSTGAQLSHISGLVDQQARQLTRLETLVFRASADTKKLRQELHVASTEDTANKGKGMFDSAQHNTSLVTDLDFGPEQQDPNSPAANATRDTVRDNPVVTTYYNEWGQSEWGRTASEALDQSVPNHPFFEEVGGDFVTDCKQTTCRLEWFAPQLADVPSQEKLDIFAAARYEMLSLAAQSIGGENQLVTEWQRRDDGVISMSTTVQRLTSQN